MIKVGITGQAGFMGTHLFNYLGLKENIERISFKDEYFNDQCLLNDFVKKCEVIVHLAAMNRHEDENVIYNTNINLVSRLSNACEITNSRPHIIFSSSTQEGKDNLYGKSKQEGRQLFEKWAKRNKAGFTAMIIPNVFGPFGQPYYNSVVATFCYQLTHDEIPEIHIDGDLKLIYINNLIDEFYQQIIKEDQKKISKYLVPPTFTQKVSKILSTLDKFREEYLLKGIIPDISDINTLALFNTFRCYIPEEHFPVTYKKHTDQRGMFVEIIRSNTSGQFSYSTTRPGVTRGNHFHIRKAERFVVIKGNAKIQLRKIGTDKIIDYKLDGKEPAFVDIPIWFTHNIANIGTEELITLFWINEPYDPDNPDTFYENV